MRHDGTGCARCFGRDVDSSHYAARCVGFNREPGVVAVNGGQTLPQVGQAHAAARLGRVGHQAFSGVFHFDGDAVALGCDDALHQHIDAATFAHRLQTMFDCVFNQGRQHHGRERLG